MSRRDVGKKREGEGREKRCMLSRRCKLMQIPHLFVSLTDLTQTEVDCPGAANTSLCPCFICTAKYPKQFLKERSLFWYWVLEAKRLGVGSWIWVEPVSGDVLLCDRKSAR